MTGTGSIEFTAGGREMKRELVFSVVLLVLYPVPILWALSRIVPLQGGPWLYVFIGAVLAVEIASAVGRTAMLRALERTEVRMDDHGITKSVGGRLERMGFGEISEVRVSRAFGFLGLLSMTVRGKGRQALYIPFFEGMEELPARLASALPDGVRIRGTAFPRGAFLAAFAAFLPAAAACGFIGLVPEEGVVFAAVLAIVPALAAFPMSSLHGARWRTADWILAVSFAVLIVSAGSALTLREVMRVWKLSKAEAAIAGGGSERASAVFGLHAIGGSRPIDVVLGLCASTDPETRRDAALALAMFRGPEALKAADSLLDDADAGVRQCAVYALGSRRRVKSIPRLISVLARPQEEASVLKAANRSLERITGESFMLDLSLSSVEASDRALLLRFWQQVWMNRLKDMPGGTEAGKAVLPESEGRD